MSSFVNKELKPLWNTNQFRCLELNLVSKFMSYLEQGFRQGLDLTTLQTTYTNYQHLQGENSLSTSFYDRSFFFHVIFLNFVLGVGSSENFCFQYLKCFNILENALFLFERSFTLTNQFGSIMVNNK